VISHDHKFIFIHVPKTGGTSIENALGLSGPRHNTALEYLNHYPEIWESYFTFSFVRNPWDRLFSYYNFRRRIRQLEAENTLTFKEWLVRIAELVKSENHKRLNVEFAPRLGVGTIEKNHAEGWRVKLDNALYMLTDEHGKVIVDFIGRFERLQQDFDIVCDKLNIAPRKLPCTNKSQHDPYWKYYDGDGEKIVAELCQKDIALFGYQFGA